MATHVATMSKHIKKYMWNVPFVTGHTYQVYWRDGLDWTYLKTWRSGEWRSTDLGVVLRFPYDDQREKFTVGGHTNSTTLMDPVIMKDVDQVVTNETQRTNFTSGAWHVNHTEEVFSVLVNGLGGATVQANGIRCVFNCTPARIPPAVEENRTRYWSVASDWEGGAVPVHGGVVTVKGSWNMILDAQPLEMDKLYIYGRLTVDPALKACEIVTNWLIVQQGEFIIGNATDPHPGNFTITLKGRKRDRVFAYSNFVMGGNKILFVSGLLQAYGLPRATGPGSPGRSLQEASVFTSLKEPASPGDTSIVVDVGLGWKAGEEVAIAPSGYSALEAETARVESYDNSTGSLVLKEGLKFYHYGSGSLKEGYGHGDFSIAAEVGLLSRSIVI